MRAKCGGPAGVGVESGFCFPHMQRLGPEVVVPPRWQVMTCLLGYLLLSFSSSLFATKLNLL